MIHALCIAAGVKCEHPFANSIYVLSIVVKCNIRLRAAPTLNDALLYQCARGYWMACHKITARPQLGGSFLLHGHVAWHCLALLGIALHCLASLGIAWHCSALLGIAWRCLALLGTAWHCLALLGSKEPRPRNSSNTIPRNPSNAARNQRNQDQGARATLKGNHQGTEQPRGPPLAK